MNRRSFVGVSGFGLLALSGCGSTDSSVDDLESTIEALEAENNGLRQQVAVQEPTERPEPAGTSLPSHTGTVGDQQVFVHGDWKIQCLAYAPLEYLMNPDGLDSYHSPSFDKFDVFVLLVNNSSSTAQTFSRGDWNMVDDIGTVNRPVDSKTFDRGPVAENTTITPGEIQEVWVYFDSERERFPKRLMTDDGTIVIAIEEGFPFLENAQSAPTGDRHIVIKPTIEPGTTKRTRRDASVPTPTPETKDGEFVTWQDWEISSMSMAGEERIEFLVTNVSDRPSVFPADRLAMIDTYGRWYQVSSLEASNSDSFDQDIVGVEIDPQDPLVVEVAIITELPREIKYLVSLDSALALAIDV